MITRLRHGLERVWGLGGELRGSWLDFAVFEAVFKVVVAGVYVPLSSWFMYSLLNTAGTRVVSNYDLVAFFLSPHGVALILAFGVATFGLSYLEFGGLLLVSAGVRSGESVSVVRVIRFMGSRLKRLIVLGFIQFLILAAIVGSAVGLVALVKVVLLRGGEIYYYLFTGPPEFWIATVIAAIVVATAGLVTVTLLVRWVFALPILLFEGVSPWHAMKASVGLVSRIGIRVVFRRLTDWLAGVLIVSIAAAVVHSTVSWILLLISGNRIGWVVATVGLMAAMDGLMALLVSFWTAVTFAALVARLYLRYAGQVDARASTPTELAGSGIGTPVRIFLVGAGVVAMAVIAVSTIYWVAERIQVDHTVQVTGHRGSSLIAPENTMPAVLAAIEAGADYVEIDVQETADGVVVLLHDTNLRRISGDERDVAHVTYEQLRELDVGGWFSAEFAGERIPRLDEVVQVAAGKVRLNIELKYGEYGPALARKVSGIVEQAGTLDETLITSLEQQAIGDLKELDPNLRRGLILTAGIGDPTRLDVDVLSVAASAVDRDLIQRVHRAGMEVHVWTVNEPSDMLTMIHLGVDNIITDAPDVLVELQKTRRGMDSPDRALLYLSDLLNGRF